MRGTITRYPVIYTIMCRGEIVSSRARFLDSQEHDHLPRKYRSRDHYTEYTVTKARLNNLMESRDKTDL